MAYSPRRYEENHVYEICMRTKEGLPFACAEIINVLLLGIMARANRDNKVQICHFVWMANHVHILLVAGNPHDFCRYYSEVMKKVTETWKSLFGLDSLLLWEKRSSVIELITPEDVEERIAYFYQNPANANLVSTIDKYPGLSSWYFFQGFNDSVDSVYTRAVKWYQYNLLPALLSEEDLTQPPCASLLKALDGFTKESFVLHPNAWMKPFGITDPDEVKATNMRIIKAVGIQQETLAAQRRSEEKSVMGVDQLKREIPTLSGWEPKKKSHRIFVICKDVSLRKEYIKEYKRFCEWCAESRKKVLAGLKDVLWPNGAFVPWFPPLLSGAICPCLVPSG
jgi:hypothetical protein